MNIWKIKFWPIEKQPMLVTPEERILIERQDDQRNMIGRLQERVCVLEQYSAKVYEALDKATQVIDMLHKKVESLLQPCDTPKPSPERWRYGDTVKWVGREYLFVSLHPIRLGKCLVCEPETGAVMELSTGGLE